MRFLRIPVEVDLYLIGGTGPEPSWLLSAISSGTVRRTDTSALELASGSTGWPGDWLQWDGTEVTIHKTSEIAGYVPLDGYEMRLSATVTQMVSDSYQDRLLAEYDQLYIRQRALYNLLSEWDELDDEPSCPFELLAEQHAHQEELLMILQRRIAIEMPWVDLPTE